MLVLSKKCIFSVLHDPFVCDNNHLPFKGLDKSKLSLISLDIVFVNILIRIIKNRL